MIVTGLHSYRDSHKAPDKGVSYDEFYGTNPWAKYLWSREQEILLDILKTFFGGREIHLLDFACGTGRVAALLEDRVTTAAGVDVSTPMLEIARQKLKRTEIIQADITADAALAGRKFNLITAFRFFLNAEPELRRAAIRAIAGLLAEDGFLVFNNHLNKSAPWVRILYAYNRLRGGHNKFMTMREVRRVIEFGGLEIVRAYPVGFLNLRRLSLPQAWHRTIDRACHRMGLPAWFSESPIFVCRKRRC